VTILTIPPTTTWQYIDDAACMRFASSVELIGKRWSSGILLAIARGATRFSEITATVVGLSDRMLAQRLKELERDALIERHVLATTPVQVRYVITEGGSDLLEALQPLADWVIKYGTPVSGGRARRDP
jgi:DNA-binding HxlR family transcriptional regulator